MTYAVFDIGAMIYWILPTAPPWYAAAHVVTSTFQRTPAARVGPEGRSHEMAVRRMMVEYGEFFWKDGWGPLYSVLGGNPLAAMPSLHFATSMMAAQLLSETGPVAGALGWGYTATLGFALVYLGEHYVVDLLAGAALTTGIRRAAPARCSGAQMFRPVLSRRSRRCAQEAMRKSSRVTADGRARVDPRRMTHGRRADAAGAGHASQRDRLRPVHPLGRRVPVFRASQACRIEQHRSSHRAGRHLVDHDRGAPRDLLVRRLCGALPGGVRARGSPIGWRESYQITMAGLAATRLFAAAGAGGIALTAWALRRSGMEPRLVACRMVAFMVLLYVIYAGAVLLGGIGLGMRLASRGRLVCDHDRAGGGRGNSVRDRRARWPSCQAISSVVWRGGRSARAG